MSTGENEQGLQKILDMSRLISIVVLVLHFYYYCYRAFEEWKLTATLSDRLLGNIQRTGLFAHPYNSKYIALGFLVISLIGARGKKEEALKFKTGFMYVLTGMLFYFLSWFCLRIALPVTTLAGLYIGITSMGYLLILTGGNLLSRVIQLKLNNRDIFNTDNETFPQEERLLQNEFSINLTAPYNLNVKTSRRWINIINSFRSLLVMGSPGAGKSYFVIRHVITQHIRKGFSMFVYDFKFDDLSVIAYNHFLKNRNRYKITPEFYVINFEDLSRTHRCNPLDKENMLDITDASESARTILMGLNM